MISYVLVHVPFIILGEKTAFQRITFWNAEFHPSRAIARKGVVMNHDHNNNNNLSPAQRRLGDAKRSLESAKKRLKTLERELERVQYSPRPEGLPEHLQWGKECRCPDKGAMTAQCRSAVADANVKIVEAIAEIDRSQADVVEETIRPRQIAPILPPQPSRKEQIKRLENERKALIRKQGIRVTGNNERTSVRSLHTGRFATPDDKVANRIKEISSLLRAMREGRVA